MNRSKEQMYRFQKLEIKSSACCRSISKNYTLHALFVNTISSAPSAHKKARIEPKTGGSSNAATPNSNCMQKENSTIRLGILHGM
jgi:hypothetical protein